VEEEEEEEHVHEEESFFAVTPLPDTRRTGRCDASQQCRRPRRPRRRCRHPLRPRRLLTLTMRLLVSTMITTRTPWRPCSGFAAR